MSFTFLEKKMVGRTGTGNFITVSVHKRGKDNKGNEKYSLVIYFSREACKEFRILGGQRYLIGFDEKLLALKPSVDGYVITASSKQSTRIQFGINGMPSWINKDTRISLSKKDCMVDEGMIILDTSRKD